MEVQQNKNIFELFFFFFFLIKSILFEFMKVLDFANLTNSCYQLNEFALRISKVAMLNSQLLYFKETQPSTGSDEDFGTLPGCLQTSLRGLYFFNEFLSSSKISGIVYEWHSIKREDVLSQRQKFTNSETNWKTFRYKTSKMKVTGTMHSFMNLAIGDSSFFETTLFLALKPSRGDFSTFVYSYIFAKW